MSHFIIIIIDWARYRKQSEMLLKARKMAENERSEGGKHESLVHVAITCDDHQKECYHTINEVNLMNLSANFLIISILKNNNCD